MRTSIKSTSKYTYSVSSQAIKILNDILTNKFFISRDLFNHIYLYEKVDTKFVKPKNQPSRTLIVYIGGWRLVGQEAGKKTLTNPTLYGKEFSFTSNLYAPGQNSQFIIKTPEGIEIAEVIEGNVINILVNIFLLSESEIIYLLSNIFKTIFSEYYRIDIATMIEETKSREHSEMVAFLIKLSSREAVAAERRVTELQDEIQRYNRMLSSLIDKRREAMIKAEGFRVNAERAANNLQEEIMKLVNMDKINNVSIDAANELLILETNDIYILNAGKRHYIGKFTIDINLTSRRVTFNNINCRRKSYWGRRCHHPHIAESGNPCWGNVGHAVTSYIAENEFQALASLLIGFLESVNTLDVAGKNITSWDVVNNAGEVIQEGYDYTNPPKIDPVHTCFKCQDSYKVEDIKLSRNGVHVCKNCADDYFVCPDCGEIHEKSDAEHCKRCGVHVCEECYEDNDLCSRCIEEQEIARQLEEPGNVLCPFCNTVINEDELHTCETCGEQGCGNCITFDGRYACPNHR